MWTSLFRRGIPSYEVDNIIGEGTNVRGDLRGPGAFRIDGSVTGSIEVDGPVVVGEKGVVEGSVKARDVVVLGRVHGNVSAKNHLEVGPAGRVMGDIEVTSFKVHVGGVFHGASRIGDAGGEARLTTNTSPFGILPISAAPSAANAKDNNKGGGRTLPPPLGAVPPPPPAALGSQPKLPIVAPAASSIERIDRLAPRESGETPKAAAND